MQFAVLKRHNFSSEYGALQYPRQDFAKNGTTRDFSRAVKTDRVEPFSLAICTSATSDLLQRNDNQFPYVQHMFRTAQIKLSVGKHRQTKA